MQRTTFKEQDEGAGLDAVCGFIDLCSFNFMQLLVQVS